MSLLVSIRVLVGSLLLLLPSAAQGLGPDGPSQAPAARRVVFEGIVMEPDGTPAAEAVVVSSAGGRAVVRADGSYRLATRVPLDAERVRLTASTDAARGATWAASGEVDSFAGHGVTPVDPLVLAFTLGDGRRWVRTFGAAPVVSGHSSAGIQAMTTFDDGGGARLYAGGRFTLAGGVPANYVASWDGKRWSPLGGGMSGSVTALAVFDAGDGPELYAGGSFLSAGGTTVNHVARWNGSSWTAVGLGTNNNVECLTVFDDGSGPALVAGGWFTEAGGVTARRIAKWDGSSWAPFGGGMGGNAVHSVAVFDDGNGPALYAGGTFTGSKIVRWDGAHWLNLGTGLTGNLSRPVGAYAMSVYDDGSGAALYVGGIFSNAGGVSARHVAKWNGSSWAALGSGVEESGNPFVEVRSLSVFDDGTGEALYVGGDFAVAGGVAAPDIARWDGTSWSGPGSPGRIPDVLAVFDDGHGAALYAGGSRGAKAWDGSSWKPLGNAPDNVVRAVTSFDDGRGEALYVAGSFLGVGNTDTRHVARWNGSTWEALGSGLDEPDFGFTTDARALAVFDDGSGPALYLAGQFQGVGGVGAYNIARWNGSTWSSVGLGVPGTLNALAVFDDGSGPALYAGGIFISLIGAPETGNGIARWNGSTWSGVGGGVDSHEVNALAVFDDGSGLALYAGGTFTSAGGVAANYIAKWNGSTWAPLGSGMNFHVNALAVFDDGSGPALYSGSSGAPQYLARWNGTSWSPVQGGMNAPVRALAVFDDGKGPALWAGGDFTTAGGNAASHVARWNGTSWAALGGGMTDSVLAFGVLAGEGGAELFVGGQGTSVDSGDAFLTRWGRPFKQKRKP